MFDNFKYRKSLKELERMSKFLNRQRQIFNLTTARQIGIVFNLFDSKVFDAVVGLKSMLNSILISTEAIGFYNDNEIPQLYTMEPGIKVFSKHELNWYKKPQSLIVDEFTAKDFDILIDLTQEEVLPLQWVSTLSRAKFKVGALNYFNNPFDLIVTVDKSLGVEYLTHQIYSTLEVLNNRFAQQTV
ncbi:MAG TPA: hypothetical protein DDY04_07075 [Bacteroidales bacterium]|nr:hypothetical protein [Bacteroidales bacterium]